jgi:DUF1009 family protein
VFWRRADSRPIGLIAGEGDFPYIFAEAATATKQRLILFGFNGITDKRVEAFAEKSHYLHLGAIGDLLNRIKSEGVRRVVLAGGIPKKQIYNPDFQMDETAKGIVARPAEKGDDRLLKAFEAALRLKCGASVVDSRRYLKSILAPKKVLTRRAPTESEWKDLRFGRKVAKNIGRMDIGQTVVVKQGVVLAVEAIEGTDQAIRRGGELGMGGVVTVKTCKPQQGLRFDLPCVGPKTLESLRAARSRVLGVEAGKTLMLFKDRFLEEADRDGVTIVGL